MSFGISQSLGLTEIMVEDTSRLAALFAGASSRTIVPLNEEARQADSSAPSFFCVHTIVGSGATDFTELAGEMGCSTRFFAVQATKKLMERFNQTPRLDFIVGHYADEIMAFQPEGRLHLGGWSSGALLALEIARRLKGRGREVGVLASIDGAPKLMKIGESRLRYYAKVLWNLPSALRNDDFGRLWSRMSRALGKMRKSAGSREIDAFAGHPVLGVVNDFAKYPAHQRLFMRNLFDAIEGEDFACYDGAVVVYRARLQPITLSGVREFWMRVAAGCVIADIDGAHADMIFQPNVRPLAADLKRRLTEGVRVG
jgi:thioesterase domain-containing protein